MQQSLQPSVVKPAYRNPLLSADSGLFLLALVPSLLSFALFSTSPILALLVQLFVLCAVMGKLSFFLLAIFAAMPFQQSLFGDESISVVNASLVDILAALLFIVLLFSLPGRGRLRIGPIVTPLFIYIGIVGASSLANWEGFSTVVSLTRMMMATLVAILIFANFTSAYRLAHRGFFIFLLALNVLAFFSMVAFAQGGIKASMYTLGINKNALGPTFGCGIVTCICYFLTENIRGRRAIFLRVSLALCTIGCLLSLSRGSWIATGVSCLLLLIISKNKRALWGSLIIIVTIVVFSWQLLPQEATDYASNISSSSYQIRSRLESIEIVLGAFRSSPLMGVGIGLRKSVEPHNVLILTLGESGIVGLIGFLGMFAGGFYTFYLAFKKTADDLPNRQLVLIGISILLLSLVHGCMDVYWRRGIGFLGWASVGLSVQILASARDSSPILATRSMAPIRNAKPIRGQKRTRRATRGSKIYD